MKKRFLRLIMLSGTLIILLTACEYDFIVPTPPTPVPPAGDTISFSQDIQPIFTAKCASCHPSVYKPNLGAGLSYSALTTGGYVVVGDPATSKLYLKVNTGGTMAGFISANQVNLIYRWIYAGAKND
ncbi:MAG: hypothetical protein WCR72_03155 [Bacteroidota bacterium]